MKTVTALKSAKIVEDGRPVPQGQYELKNPCQMWRCLRGWVDKFGHNIRIIVTAADDSIYKDFTVKELKNGKYILVNAVKETNRTQVAKARKEAAEKAAKIEAKKAKRRAYDKARRERLKAQKTQD